MDSPPNKWLGLEHDLRTLSIPSLWLIHGVALLLRALVPLHRLVQVARGEVLPSPPRSRI
jgi:hypothetical protein